jgi:hypothetical protein
LQGSEDGQPDIFRGLRRARPGRRAGIRSDHREPTSSAPPGRIGTWRSGPGRSARSRPARDPRRRERSVGHERLGLREESSGIMSDATAGHARGSGVALAIVTSAFSAMLLSANLATPVHRGRHVRRRHRRRRAHPRRLAPAQPQRDRTPGRCGSAPDRAAGTEPVKQPARTCTRTATLTQTQISPSRDSRHSSTRGPRGERSRSRRRRDELGHEAVVIAGAGGSLVERPAAAADLQ